MNHGANRETDHAGIQERLEEMQRRLQVVAVRASESSDPGTGNAEPALDTAVEDLHAAAQELASAARHTHAERRRYEQLFQLAPCLVTDQQAVIEQANQAAGVLFECDPRSVVGAPLLDVVRPEHRERLSALQDAARAEPGRVIVADDVTVTVDDHPVPVIVRCRAVSDPDDQLAGFGWVVEDLSGRLNVERRARQEQEEESARLRDAADHWQRLESAKSHFLNLASHELRTPVTVLGGYLSMLDEGSFGELPAPVERVVALLVAKTCELNDLINDMLETARLDEDRVGLQVVPVDAGDVVGQLVEDWRPLTTQGQALSFAAPAEQVTVEADPTRLRTIITNLIGNAIKYSPDGGDIVCSVSSNDGQALISVRDSGLGIAPEGMALLFTRFGRVVTPATSRLPGTGLGLYIARELARVHGGDITVRSVVGEGSEFTVSLPLRTVPPGETIPLSA